MGGFPASSSSWKSFARRQIGVQRSGSWVTDPCNLAAPAIFLSDPRDLTGVKGAPKTPGSTQASKQAETGSDQRGLRSPAASPLGECQSGTQTCRAEN